MKWKRVYGLILVSGILLIIVSLFFSPPTAFILGIPGIFIILFAALELIMIKTKDKQPLTTPEVVKPKEIEKTEKPIAFSQPQKPEEKKLSLFRRLFKKKKQTEKKEKSKQEKPGKKEEIKVIQKKEETKITLLRRYIEESLQSGYPKEKILESAMKSKWPKEMIDQILEEFIGKRVKKKLYALGGAFVILFIVFLTLLIRGMFLIPYWFKAAGEASGLFYIALVIIILAIILIFYKKIRKTLKKKKVEYRIQESSHVEEIKEALTKFEGGYETDIDKFYALVAQQKKVTIPAVAKAFKISEETAEEWAKILADQNLVELHYPTMGDPEVLWKSSKTTK